MNQKPEKVAELLHLSSFIVCRQVQLPRTCVGEQELYYTNDITLIALM